MTKFTFVLDRGSGVPAYRQLEDQVLAALHLGLLVPGDQLPTVAEVVRQVGLNANTVLRAYRELERRGFTLSKPGIGTLVIARPEMAGAAAIDAFADAFEALVGRALDAGLAPDVLRQVTSAVLDHLLAPAREG